MEAFIGIYEKTSLFWKKLRDSVDPDTYEGFLMLPLSEHGNYMMRLLISLFLH